ncbi:MAG: alpha-amylase family glycosyl hydrolase [Rhodobacter sp.]|nr:alpha-amylase family glycosyl hydrolase [Rhodobacter sp.]
MDDWWRGAVIYQIYPRSFKDTTGSGVGDLPGIARRLDHVASLGADAIWLSPFFPSPMDDMGYDVSDYCGVDPLFGTLADFDALVARAHDLGLKVIIDQVFNHSSDRHPWFAESRTSRENSKADWYVWADPKPDGSPPNNWPSVFGGPAWAWEPQRRQYYLHNFLASQPDLNFHCPDVVEALLDTMRFWLDRGVDGFRLDTVNYYTHDAGLRDNPPAAPEDVWPPGNHYDMQAHLFSKSQAGNLGVLERMRALTDRYSARAMVGEVGERDRAIEIMAEYTSGPRRLHMAYSFDMLGPEFTAAHFRTRIERFFAGAPDGWPCWSFSNHDVARHAGRWQRHGVSQDAVAKQAISLLASFEGTLGIYQGEELGLTDTELEYHELTDPVGLRFWPDNKGRDGARTPMVWKDGPQAGFSDGVPWLPVKGPQAARNVAAQEADPASVLHHYRRVLTWRKTEPALLHGRTEFLEFPEPVLGFHRRAGEAVLTCLFNLSPDPVALTAPGAEIAGPHHAELADRRLTLPGSGFAWLRGSGKGVTIQMLP